MQTCVHQDVCVSRVCGTQFVLMRKADPQGTGRKNMMRNKVWTLSKGWRKRESSGLYYFFLVAAEARVTLFGAATASFNWGMTVTFFFGVLIFLSGCVCCGAGAVGVSSHMVADGSGWPPSTRSIFESFWAARFTWRANFTFFFLMTFATRFFCLTARVLPFLRACILAFLRPYTICEFKRIIRETWKGTVLENVLILLQTRASRGKHRPSSTVICCVERETRRRQLLRVCTSKCGLQPESQNALDSCDSYVLSCGYPGQLLAPAQHST